MLRGTGEEREGSRGGRGMLGEEVNVAFKHRRIARICRRKDTRGWKRGHREDETGGGVEERELEGTGGGSGEIRCVRDTG